MKSRSVAGSSPGHLTVALIQLTATADAEGGRRRALDWVEEGALAGADLIALPEVFHYLGPEEGKLASAETLEGPTLTALGERARKHRIWILAGSLSERSSIPGKVYNTSVLLNSQGGIAGVYRKIHLFDVDLKGGPSLRESDTVLPGDDPVVVPAPFGMVGMSVCYDLRFPELYRVLARNGARLLFVPSAFTAHTGKDHWEVLLRARAIENQAFVIAPGQWGRHSPSRVSHGRSMVVDPWGVVVACAPDREGITLARLDLQAVDKVRAQIPTWNHLRIGF